VKSERDPFLVVLLVHLCVVPSFLASGCFFIPCIRCVGKPLLRAMMSILLHSCFMARSEMGIVNILLV